MQIVDQTDQPTNCVPYTQLYMQTTTPSHGNGKDVVSKVVGPIVGSCEKAQVSGPSFVFGSSKPMGLLREVV